MSRVRAKDTAPERVVRSMLHRLGLRFRKHVEALPGKPDIVLPKYKTVVFVHGCFWHQHRNCKRSRRPVSNAAYWNDKLDANKRRDQSVKNKLSRAGWKLMTVWTCQLNDPDRLLVRLQKIRKNASGPELESKEVK